MRTSALILFTLLISPNISAQDFDHLMTRRNLDCADIAFNSSIHFVRLMEENKVDSAAALIHYWERRCGEQEPVFRARILLALHQGNRIDTMLTKGSLSHINNFIRRLDMVKQANFQTYEFYRYYFGYVPPAQEFDLYTRIRAAEILNHLNAQSAEYLIAELYAGQSENFFEKLRELNPSATPLATEYHETVRYYRAMPEWHMSWLTGVWVPTGDLRKLGTHPELGFQIGMKQKKMNYDVVVAFKFINSPNPYFARRTRADNSLEMTRHFFGGHLGLDVGRDIYARNGHEWQITGGIAFDGFDALKEDKPYGLEPESTSSYNFSFGPGYRYYFSDIAYFGFRVKYNVVDYTLNNVIDFTGNPVTIHFIIGGLNNNSRNPNLKNLAQPVRK
jgi:hypothetical protein